MPAKWCPPDPAYLVQNYLSGMTLAQLAQHFGVRPETVRRALVDAGAPPRDRSAVMRQRMKTADPEERKRLTRAANAAVRGSHTPIERLACRARSIQQRGRLNTREQQVQQGLLARGIATVAQQAVGPYNVDLAAAPVAVEVYGGGWHFSGRHAARFPKRTVYLANAGWHMLVLWNSTYRPLDAATLDHAAAFIKEARRNPALRRQYRVVRGAAEVTAAGCIHEDDLTMVLATACRLDGP